MLHVMNPKDREDVQRLAATMRFVPPTLPEKRSKAPKELAAQGVTITYPGDWTMTPDSPRRPRPVLSGALCPIARWRQEGTTTDQESPELGIEVVRLDDMTSDLSRMSRWQPDQTARFKQSCEYNDQPFVTASGWLGRRWTSTLIADGRRGRSVHRSILYILPMPDGVMALAFTGRTSSRAANQGTAEKLEEQWRKIVASARTEAGVARPTPGPTGPMIVTD